MFDFIGENIYTIKNGEDIIYENVLQHMTLNTINTVVIWSYKNNVPFQRM